jgi:hypothetical protein
VDVQVLNYFGGSADGRVGGGRVRGWAGGLVGFGWFWRGGGFGGSLNLVGCCGFDGG